MASASEIISDPRLDIPLVTAETSVTAQNSRTDELAHFRLHHADIEKLMLRILNLEGPHKIKTVDVRAHVLDAVFEESIDQTPTFVVTLFDENWSLLNHGGLNHIIDVNPGKIKDRWYRLEGHSVSDDEITMTFMTRNASYLQNHRRRKHANRKKVTRAMFILTLLREVKQVRIKFFCPQLHKRQKVGKTNFNSEPTRKAGRSQGFDSSDKIKVKNNDADEEQRTVIEDVIRAGQDSHAPKLVILAAVMCVMWESEARNHPVDHSPLHAAKFKGAFQQDTSWPQTQNAYKDAIGNGKLGTRKGGFYGMAIPAWRKDPNVDIGGFVQRVQVAIGPGNFGYPGFVNQQRKNAEHALKVYGGIDVGDLSNDPGSPQQVDYKKKFVFHVGEPDGPNHENYLSAIYRLAEEVNWRAYWVKDTLHFMSEDDLFKSKPRVRLKRYEHGIEHVNFDWDQGKAVNEMHLQVRMDNWVAPMGTTVAFDEGGPAHGRWLVTNIRRSIFDELGEITLKKPLKERLEPANEPGSREPRNQGEVGLDAGGRVRLGGCNIEQVKSSWRPDSIIYSCIMPKARDAGMLSGITKAGIIQANHDHKEFVSGTRSTSWHKGHGYDMWAVDMGMGTQEPTSRMDDLAASIIAGFNLPDLANWHATSKNGYVPGNLINKEHKGFAFQLIYRTNLPQGGNHYTHVHFGVKKISHTPFHQGGLH